MSGRAESYKYKRGERLCKKEEREKDVKDTGRLGYEKDDEEGKEIYRGKYNS